MDRCLPGKRGLTAEMPRRVAADGGRHSRQRSARPQAIRAPSPPLRAMTVEGGTTSAAAPASAKAAPGPPPDPRWPGRMPEPGVRSAAARRTRCSPRSDTSRTCPTVRRSPSRRPGPAAEPPRSSIAAGADRHRPHPLQPRQRSDPLREERRRHRGARAAKPRSAGRPRPGRRRACPHRARRVPSGIS